MCVAINLSIRYSMVCSVVSMASGLGVFWTWAGTDMVIAGVVGATLINSNLLSWLDGKQIILSRVNCNITEICLCFGWKRKPCSKCY